MSASNAPGMVRWWAGQWCEALAAHFFTERSSGLPVLFFVDDLEPVFHNAAEGIDGDLLEAACGKESEKKSVCRWFHAVVYCPNIRKPRFNPNPCLTAGRSDLISRIPWMYP